jgi:hypothetical protein
LANGWTKFKNLILKIKICLTLLIVPMEYFR